MKRMKFLVIVLILFLSVGFAAINTNLDIIASTIVQQSEDFDVYFSDARVNGVQDITVVESATELKFIPEFSKGNYVLDYKVTNGSKNYDAEVVVNCTGAGNDIIITNEFDASTLLEASESRSGKLVVQPLLDLIYTDSDNSGSISKGDLYVLRSNENEKFNVIGETDETIILLAQYNLDSTYRQNTTQTRVKFSSTNGWTYAPAPKEIDIQAYDGNAKTYVNEYVTYLKSEIGDSSLSGNLLTLPELGELECVYPNRYYLDFDTSIEATCINSSYKDWLINGQDWWLRSAVANDGDKIWSFRSSGDLDDIIRYNAFSLTMGIRPSITISKEVVIPDVDNLSFICTIESIPVENSVLGDAELPDALEKCKWEYTDLDNSGDISIGDEYTYCTEKFNVINLTSDKISLLAKYTLGQNYRQSSITNAWIFSSSNGWEYTPGPKDIDIFTWSKFPKIYVNNYVSWFKQKLNNDDILGNLITLLELEKLGCIIPSDYATGEGYTCANSQYASWLLNGQYWWTRSAFSSSSNYIWRVNPSGVLGGNSYNFSNSVGIRPIIIVSKDMLEGEITTSEAVIFCEEKGYPYGIMNDGTFVPEPSLMYPTDGNLEDAVYLCLQNGKDDYTYVSGYNLAGEQVYNYSDERLPYE